MLAGRDDKESWIHGFSGKFRRAQRAGCRIESGNVNALALHTGVSAEINQLFAGETGRWPQQG